MVSSIVYILTGAFLLLILFIIFKKPEVLKKDASKPFSIKNFNLKKTFIGDWKQFLTWMLLMFLVWSYAHDTQACRDMIEDIDMICIQRQEQLMLEREMGVGGNFYNNELNLGGEYGKGDDTRGDNQQGVPNTVP